MNASAPSYAENVSFLGSRRDTFEPQPNLRGLDLVTICEIFYYCRKDFAEVIEVFR
jgi:hypothetical protein